MSQIKYNSEGGIALLRQGVAFIGLCERNEVPSDNISCGLFSYTFERHVEQWCHTFPVASIHSFNHMIRELGSYFFYSDHKAHNKKTLKLQKAPDESIVHFLDRFCNISFQILEDEID